MKFTLSPDLYHRGYLVPESEELESWGSVMCLSRQELRYGAKLFENWKHKSGD